MILGPIIKARIYWGGDILKRSALLFLPLFIYEAFMYYSRQFTSAQENPNNSKMSKTKGLFFWGSILRISTVKSNFTSAFFELLLDLYHILDFQNTFIDPIYVTNMKLFLNDILSVVVAETKIRKWLVLQFNKYLSKVRVTGTGMEGGRWSSIERRVRKEMLFCKLVSNSLKNHERKDQIWILQIFLSAQ